MDQFIQLLQQILLELDSRIGSLEHTLNDVIIQTWKEAAEEEDRAKAALEAAAAKKAALDAFRSKYPQVGQLEGPLKALYGDSYDPYEDLYLTMQGHTGDEGFDESKYVDGQVADVLSRLDKVASGSYGAPEATDEEIFDEAQLARELAMAQ